MQAASSTSTVSITAERAGPEQAHFAGSGVGPVQAWRSTNVAAGASSSSAGPVQASSSSSADLGPVQALRSTNAAAGGSMSFGPVQASAASSGPVQASSSSGAEHFADASGLEQALAAVARISESAAAGGGIEHALKQRAGEVSEALLGGGRSEMTLHNPWDLFQHEHRGKGWSPAKMSAMYKKWKGHPGKDKMP